jgi:hypothetical protein
VGELESSWIEANWKAKASMPTHPGLNPNFQLRAFPPDEQQAILRLSRYFYITRVADSVQIGNSSYRSFLMRPAEEVSVVLNVEREIVVLFADYETFEARTLQAFNRTCEQFDDVRVDRSIRFLITRDKDIESSIGIIFYKTLNTQSLFHMYTVILVHQLMVLYLIKFGEIT